MEQLKINLKNCYGIKKLQAEFNFTTEHNVNVIYAKNGLMKTSFAKVFKKFQDGKEAQIKDLIFNKTPVVKDITVDDNNIEREEIFVINSFEKAYESNSISTLLINDDIKVRLQEIIEIKNEIFNDLKDKSGLDLNKSISTKGLLKLEEQLIKDFNFTEKSFLQNIESINLDNVDYDYSDIDYSIIFHKAVLKNIQKNEFQQNIDDYILRSNEIYRDYTFLQSGNFNLPKLKDIKKELETSNFFVNENKVVLDGDIHITSPEEIQAQIIEIETRLQETTEFRAIDKALGTKEGKFLKDLIENNIHIIEELRLDNLDNLRKKLWLSYLKEDEINFNRLKERYNELRADISNLNIDDTLWRKSIKIFNNRFSLPFTMEIDNPISSIMGESLPKIIFSFQNDEGDLVKLNRDDLEKEDTLSQGEKRALYLLNIIFDIEKRKVENQRTLFIIDDIADSFDYKNKYAIIEYLNDISKENNFYMIILSHNFDFYRTVSSRLKLPHRSNKFHAIKDNNEIKIIDEEYQNNVFKTWKNTLNNKKIILALIPFIRNLIEFGIDKQVNTLENLDEDYNLLTNLLHLKNDTKGIDFQQLKIIYLEYIGKDNFTSYVNNTDKVYDLIISIANTDISNNDINLENKIILAIAIRLKAEEYMINKINDIPWTNTIIGNQTRILFKKYSDKFENEKENIKLLESVNIMTPENIHLNSFMYEPLLDMDIIELKELYNNIKTLSNAE